MNAFNVMLTWTLIVAGMLAACGGAPEAAAADPTITETVSAPCKGNMAQAIFPEPVNQVQYATLATIHEVDGGAHYQHPAFESYGFGTRATVYCFEPASAVFERWFK